MPSCDVLVAISLAIAILILFPFSNLLSLSDFNFDAVGDWGCNSNTQSTVKNIKGNNPDRIFALGDYSYPPTATCWLNAINSIKSVTRINNTQTTEKKVPKELNNNVTVDNSNQNAESKPIIPKTTDEDVITGIRNILPEADVKRIC